MTIYVIRYVHENDAASAGKISMTAVIPLQKTTHYRLHAREHDLRASLAISNSLPIAT